MRKTNTCPKCESTEIIRIPGRAGLYGSGNTIPAGLTILSSILVTRLLCARCGFSDEWTEKREKTQKEIQSEDKTNSAPEAKISAPGSRITPLRKW